MRILTLILVIVVLTACNSSTPLQKDAESSSHTRLDAESCSLMTVELDQAIYTLGGVAEVTITNRSDGLLLFAMMCDGFVDGRSDDEWEIVYQRDCSNIRVIPTRLEVGDTVVVDFNLRPCSAEELPKYDAFRLRVRFQANDNVGYHAAYSSEFLISAQ